MNQAMAKWHSTDEQPPELMRAVALVARILPGLEEAAAAVHRAQGGAGRRRAIQSARRRPAPDQRTADGVGAGE